MQQHQQSLAQFRLLLWKEWRVWKWPFALYSIGILYGVVYDLIYRRNDFDPNPTLCVLLLFYGFFVPVLVGVRTATAEASQKTLSFSASLPCSRRLLTWIRLASAAFVVVGPPILGAIVHSICLLSGLGFTGESSFVQRSQALLPLGKGLTILCLEQVSLMLVIAVIGANRKSEVQVGVYGAVASTCQILLRCLPAFPELNWPGRSSDWYGVLIPSHLLNPFHVPESQRTAAQLFFAEHVWGPLLLHGLILLALGVWFTRRYGKPAPASTQDVSASWFGLPSLTQAIIRSRSPRAALIWLNLRQVLPLIIAGWMMTALMCALILIIQSGYRSASSFSDLLLEGLSPVSLLWAAVIGAGIFTTELRSDLGHFWRSRPISTSTWFWVKYVIGLVAVVGSLDLMPLLLVTGYDWMYVAITHRGIFPWKLSLIHLACFPIIHAACYTLAVLGVTWLRRPAIVAALCVPIVLVVEEWVGSQPRLILYSALNVFRSLENNLDEPGVLVRYAVTYGTIIMLTGLGACAASRATRRNSLQSLSSPLASFTDRLRGRKIVTEVPS